MNPCSQLLRRLGISSDEVQQKSQELLRKVNTKFNAGSLGNVSLVCFVTERLTTNKCRVTFVNQPFASSLHASKSIQTCSAIPNPNATIGCAITIMMPNNLFSLAVQNQKFINWRSRQYRCKLHITYQQYYPLFHESILWQNVIGVSTSNVSFNELGVKFGGVRLATQATEMLAVYKVGSSRRNAWWCLRLFCIWFAGKGACFTPGRKKGQCNFWNHYSQEFVKSE